MANKIPCEECGAMILPTTAEANDGVCMPCKRGYRESIEASKKRDREERAYRETPVYRHWVWLVEQVHGDGIGFESLSEPNRLFFAATIVGGEVYNGGFLQYFGNSAGNFFRWSVDGLKVIGANKSLELLEEAARIVWGTVQVPKDQAERIEFLHGDDENLTRDAMLRQLDSLDHEFYKDEDELYSLLEAYRNRERLDEGF